MYLPIYTHIYVLTLQNHWKEDRVMDFSIRVHAHMHTYMHPPVCMSCIYVRQTYTHSYTHSHNPHFQNGLCRMRPSRNEG